MANWMWGRRLRRGVLLPVACLLAATGTVALAAGCGSSERSSRPVRKVVQVAHVPRDRWTYARQRFREGCGGCHTLADAGTHGPRFNLDHAAKIDATRARYAIAEGEPGMPAWKGVLSRREYEELVAYVSHVQHLSRGETNWSWQIRLRTEGEEWTPDRGTSSPGPPLPRE
jgi:mono/diheme cytochrome c family protein